MEENDHKYFRRGTKDVFQPCPRVMSRPERTVGWRPGDLIDVRIYVENFLH